MHESWCPAHLPDISNPLAKLARYRELAISRPYPLDRALQSSRRIVLALLHFSAQQCLDVINMYVPEYFGHFHLQPSHWIPDELLKALQCCSVQWQKD